jgi:predicted helicase
MGKYYVVLKMKHESKRVDGCMSRRKQITLEIIPDPGKSKNYILGCPKNANKF